MKGTITSVAVGAAFFAPLAAFAQTNEAVTTVTTTSAAGAVAGAAMAGGMMVFFGILALVALAFFVFWILMLIDCTKRQWPDKNLWLIILIVSLFTQLSWLAAILYYFMVKKPNLGGGPVAMTGPAPQPPQPPTPPAPPAA